MENMEVYHIGGHKVMFPFKPYPSQFDMMNKILSGLDKRLNCLLESPTGSGKTLSLLCSSLAWQKTEAAKVEILNTENKKNICDFCWDPYRYHNTHHVLPKQKKTKVAKDKNNSKKRSMSSSKTEEMETSTCCNKESDVSKQSETTSSQQDDDDDFRDFSEMVKAQHAGQNTSKSSRSHVAVGYENTQESDAESDNGCGDCNVPGGCGCYQPEISYTECDRCVCQCNGHSENTSKKLRVPKIYFGTRTHKQIKQIVGELKETRYKDVRMCILSSRDNLCINQEVREKPSINEACKEFLEHQRCSYITGAQRFSTQEDIRMFGLTEAWDIEDLVKICKSKKMRACPYFLTRSLMKESDIIFCPYNYLLDPTIRRIMEINLKGNIVILDEGHNIEDSCREAITVKATTTLLTILIKELHGLIKKGICTERFQYLLDLVYSLHSFIHSRSADLQQTDFSQASKVWSGFQAIAELVHMKIGPKDIKDLSRCLQALRDEKEKYKKRKMDFPKLSSVGYQLFEQLLMSLTYFYMNELKNAEDFRLVLLRSVTFGPKKGLRSKSKSENSGPREELTLHLWCLNPGVTFSDFSVTRSVIITSGTLSPMGSFQSELEFPFSVRMEARHVIPPSQVLVRAIGCGPSGRSLVATYKHTETYTFQDDLGDIVCDVCMRTPNGMLCFLSSYTLLDKLCKRWQATGLWEKIWKRKIIVIEPRSGKKEDFTDAWRRFKTYAQGDFTDSEKEEEITQDGALFLAVCRGKLSEGIDFADNSARAVITVGIPYPNVKDIQVSLKKEYNELHKRTKNLLPGNDWLETQAFRALNQALGRCIRHKNDWGALILVDSRFLQGNRYHKGLSKWVRDMLKSQSNYNVAMQTLTTFMKDKTKVANLLLEKSSNSIENNQRESGNLHMEPIKASTPIAKRNYGVHPEGESDRNNLTPESLPGTPNKRVRDAAELSSVLPACSPSSKSDEDFLEMVPQTTGRCNSLTYQPVLVQQACERPDEVESQSPSKTSKDRSLADTSSTGSKTQLIITEDYQSKKSKLAAGDGEITNEHPAASLNPHHVKFPNSETNGKKLKCSTETNLKCSQSSSLTGGSPVLFNELNDATDDAELLSVVESEAEKSLTKEFDWSDELSESSDSLPDAVKTSDLKGHSTLIAPRQPTSVDSSGEIFNEDPDLMTFIENSTKGESFSSTMSSVSHKESKGDDSKTEGRSNSTMSNHKLQRCPLFKASSNHPHVTSTPAAVKNNLEGIYRLSPVQRDPFAELLEFESQELKLKRSTGRKRRPSSNYTKYKKKSRGDSTEEKEQFVILCKTCHQNLFSVHSNIEKRTRIPPLLKDIFTDTQCVFLYLAANTSDQLDSVSNVKFPFGNGAGLNSCWFPKHGCCVEYLQCMCGQGTKQTIVGVRVLLGSTDYPTGQLWLLDEAVKINSVHD